MKLRAEYITRIVFILFVFPFYQSRRPQPLNRADTKRACTINPFRSLRSCGLLSSKRERAQIIAICGTVNVSCYRSVSDDSAGASTPESVSVSEMECLSLTSDLRIVPGKYELKSVIRG
jgi:hypothetical protein